jgi:hypothetical protein
MQAPYPFKNDDSAHFVKDLDFHKLNEDRHYVSMNSGLKELKRKPIRQTYTVRGMEVMMPQGVSKR